MVENQKRQGFAEKLRARQEVHRETVHEENLTISRLSPKVRTKEQVISVRVYPDTYKQFKMICGAKGITANACLNTLIAEYVASNNRIFE